MTIIVIMQLLGSVCEPKYKFYIYCSIDFKRPSAETAQDRTQRDASGTTAAREHKCWKHDGITILGHRPATTPHPFKVPL